MTNNFIPLTRDIELDGLHATDKPDLVDDVMNGGESEIWNMAIDKAIEEVYAEATITKSVYEVFALQRAINKLKALKK